MFDKVRLIFTTMSCRHRTAPKAPSDGIQSLFGSAKEAEETAIHIVLDVNFIPSSSVQVIPIRRGETWMRTRNSSFNAPGTRWIGTMGKLLSK